MIVFETSAIYIESAATKVERLNKVEEVIDGLYDLAIKAAAGENIKDYFLNDGQVQIKTTYRGVEEIQKSIMAFERIKQMLLNQLNGRITNLMDGKNFV